MIKAIIAACLLCVSSVSFVEANEPEDYALFRNIQCQHLAYVSNYEDAMAALWARNDEVIRNNEYDFSAFDVAIIVNQQYDHAMDNIIRRSIDTGDTIEASAMYLYSKYCSNI